MNRPLKISRVSGPPVSGAQDAAVSVPANETAATLNPGAVAGEAQSVGSAGNGTTLEVTTPLARIHSQKTAPNLPDDGYGRQPRCITCRKGMSNCLCDAPDIDVPSVHDMARIYPSLFEDRGWALAERSAYGMAVKR